jgi:hypothetical protein
MSARIATRKGFERAIWAAVEPYAVRLIEDERKWREAIRASDPAGKLPIPDKQRVVRRDDLFLHMLFQAYNEMEVSFDTLLNIPVYLDHFPSSLAKRVSRPKWLRYHTENYLHELYIFQNRVESFFRLLRRAYRNERDAASLKKSFDDLEQKLKVGLSNVIKARGRHVHEHRFDDTTLRALEAAEFLEKFEARSTHWYSGHVKDATFEKIFWMKRSNSEIRRWLDKNGRTLGRLIFGRSGSFRFPSASPKGAAE